MATTTLKIVRESGARPLIGRAEELQLIAAALNGSSNAVGVVITGALGVGKSRLAREAVTDSGRCAVRWTAGSSAGRGIPLGAFINWLPDDVVDPAQATGRVVAELLGGGGPGGVVIGVDDAHMLDDTSAFVLHRIVERRLARVVLTVRSDMEVPDSVAALWRDGALQRLDLQPLGHADCVTLVKTVLGGAVDPVSERRLWQLTRGNVRFIRDIVEQELARGAHSS